MASPSFQKIYVHLIFYLIDLKQLCIAFLKLTINAENCLTLRSLADCYHSDELLGDVNKFIRENVKNILSRDKFKTLTEDELCVCMKMVRTQNPVKNKKDQLHC